MGNIYLTSDLHFGHEREFLYGPRGFASIQEHDEAVITRWNETIQEDDDVYVLGDLMLNDNEHGLECLRRLNGRLHLIRGNHDTDARWKLYSELENVVELCGWSCMLRIGKRYFYLSHWPVRIGNGEEVHGPYCLHGHTHHDNAYEYIEDRCYNVNLDAHNCYPVAIEDIIKNIKDSRSAQDILG